MLEGVARFFPSLWLSRTSRAMRERLGTGARRARPGTVPGTGVQCALRRRQLCAVSFRLTMARLRARSISDQYTRAKVKSNGKEKNPRVIGCLMGVQRGRDVEIFNSFELVHTVNEGKIEIDQQFLIMKKEQFAQPFPNYDVLGEWRSAH